MIDLEGIHKIRSNSGNTFLYQNSLKNWNLDITLVILFLGTLFAAAASIVFWSLRNGISPMPTSLKAKRALLAALPKEVHGAIYELGSGWGTLAIPLAKKYSKCQVLGYETSILPFWFSKLCAAPLALPNLHFCRRDFYQAPLHQATLVVCYLYPGAMLTLKSKFIKELPSGAYVVSNTFSIPDWDPDAVVEVHDLYNTKIYIYRIKK